MILERPHRSSLMFLLDEIRMIENGNTREPLPFENDHAVILDDSKGFMADTWPFTFMCALCDFRLKYDRPNRKIEIISKGSKHYETTRPQPI